MGKSILVVLFIIGVAYRLWFASLSPQPLIFDQKEYHEIATAIVTRDIPWASTYRLHGYPLILAVLYNFFGIDNPWPFEIFQAVMDTSVAVCIYFIAREIFKEKTAAWFGFSLYLFNPITAAYTGVRLTEIAAIFFFTVSIYLMLLFLRLRLKRLYLLAAFTLGYLYFVRPGFLYFGIIMLIAMNYLMFKKTLSPPSLKLGQTLLIQGVGVLLFVLPIVYNLLFNWFYFRSVAPLTIDNLFVREFYISLFVGNEETAGNFPPEVMAIYQEYSTPTTDLLRRQMVDKYKGLAIKKIVSDPAGFALSRILKSWYVWEKHKLFPLTDMAPRAVPYLYWGNIILILSAFCGFTYWWIGEAMKNRNRLKIICGALLGFSAFYISVLHAFTITAERFSLPFYPFLAIFAGYAVSKIFLSEKK